MNGTETYKCKAKYFEIVATSLCLGIISKDWSTDNTKKTGFNGYIYDLVQIIMLLMLMKLKTSTNT